MKTLFDIRSGKPPGVEHTLLLEAGEDFCSYAYLHKPTKTIDGLHYVSFDETESEGQLPALIKDLGATPFQSVVVCSAFPQALLMPTKFFDQDYTALKTIYVTHAEQKKLNDPIPEWQMTAVYLLPQQLSEALPGLFQSVQYFHAYTPSIKIYNGYIADSQLLVHFTQRYFRLLLKKDSSIQLAQTYAYKTPLDVVYYLLKICSEFALQQQEIFIIFSGLVEQDSALFTEIEQYFTNVHFAHPPEIKLPVDEHPQHFFTSLYNLASCVS
ncbi:MAG TPA: DUF3822 family protein [Flavisolibacter sp.]|nr:DUF3822 family protein [Flavisolibacter sp.]